MTSPDPEIDGGLPWIRGVDPAAGTRPGSRQDPAQEPAPKPPGSRGGSDPATNLGTDELDATGEADVFLGGDTQIVNEFGGFGGRCGGFTFGTSEHDVSDLLCSVNKRIVTSGEVGFGFEFDQCHSTVTLGDCQSAFCGKVGSYFVIIFLGRILRLHRTRKLVLLSANRLKR